LYIKNSNTEREYRDELEDEIINNKEYNFRDDPKHIKQEPFITAEEEQQMIAQHEYNISHD
jgi:hypothetical protein